MSQDCDVKCLEWNIRSAGDTLDALRLSRSKISDKPCTIRRRGKACCMHDKGVSNSRPLSVMLAFLLFAAFRMIRYHYFYFSKS